MRKFIVGILAVLVSASIAFTSHADSKDAPAKSPLLSDGPLQKSRDVLATIFHFTADGDKLQFDRDGWAKAAKECEESQAAKKAEADKNPPQHFPANSEMAEQMQDERDAQEFIEKRRRERTIAKMGPVPPLQTLFSAIEEQFIEPPHRFYMHAGFGPFGDGGLPHHSIRGDFKEWQNSFDAKKMLAGDVRTNNDAEILQLRELAAPFRTFELRTDNKNGFSLRLSEQSGDTVLVRQAADGRFTLVALTPGSALTAKADSFADLIKQNTDAFRSTVTPILTNLGIDLPNIDSSDAAATPSSVAAPKPFAQWRDCPLFGDGELQRAGAPLGQIFNFLIQDNHLVIDRDAWDRDTGEIKQKDPDINDPVGKMPADLAKDPKAAAAWQMSKGMQSMMGFGSESYPAIVTLFKNVGVSLGSNSGGSGGGGGDGDYQWHASFSDKAISADMETNTSSTADLRFTEFAAPKRKLEFKVDHDLAFVIELSNELGDLFSIHQGSTGRFSIVAISGDAIYAAQAPSFIEFCKQNRELVDSELLPAFVPLGFTPIQPTNSTGVRKAVLASLSRSQEELEKGRELLAQLDGDTVDARTAARKELIARYNSFVDLIQQKSIDQSASAEVRAAQTNPRRPGESRIGRRNRRRARSGK